MKVLIVSHNSFSRSSNMGKTLLSYFGAFSGEELAQFYIHSEVPTEDTLCRNYYRFTDRDALRSWVTFAEQGKVFRKEDIQTGRLTPRTDTALTARVYQYGRKRTALIYFLRNLLWKGSRWNTKGLQQWAAEFDPDVIFLASGDYGFLYDIAGELAALLKKPLVISCVDDYYLHNRNAGTCFGRLVHGMFMKTVTRRMAQARAVFVICPAMQKAYEKRFGKKCYVLHTSARQNSAEVAETYGISYLGNLGYRRGRQLMEMGRALKAIRGLGIPEYIDVYSGERNPDVIKLLTPENGIHFHGMVSPEQAAEILAGSRAVIHTESFDEDMRRLTRFSVSTKIPDSLTNGRCIIAYGPAGIASMDYLAENRAAYVITDPGKLEQGLREILTDENLRRAIRSNARELAKKHHDAQRTSMQLRHWLEEICEETGGSHENFASKLRL